MKSKKRFTAAAAAILIAAACLLIWRLSRPEQLVLSDQISGRVFARYDVAEGDTFSVTFRHSVNKSNVTEIYEVCDGAILLVGCDYYDFGAGVAEVLDPGWVLETTDDGVMRITNINMPMNDLTYIVGTVYDHILSIHGEEIILNELCGKNSKVHFEIH